MFKYKSLVILKNRTIIELRENKLTVFSPVEAYMYTKWIEVQYLNRVVTSFVRIREKFMCEKS